MSHPSQTELDRIKILQAALDVAGSDTIIPISEPLPKERRQHLYAVPDTHDLGKMYGVSKLSAILSETKTPHLTDYDMASTRRGLRYVDNSSPIHDDLLPFTDEDARRAWRGYIHDRQKETRALTQAAQTAQSHPKDDLVLLFPDPAQENLPEEAKIPNSKKTAER